MTEATVVRSVVLPAYNEETYIKTMVERTIRACEARTDPFEVIVVDNASSDSTPFIVSQIALDDSRVRLIRHPDNKLYAGSCATGAGAARGDRVFIIDSDGQHDPADVWVIDQKLDQGY
ncbi:MAG: glycosyltransferase family 2 protein, partial [bacterium]